MWTLLKQLARDEVGSSVTTEMSLVTGVTVGALVMSMGDFSANVNRQFKNVANSSALKASDLDKKREQEEKERQAEFDRIKAEAEQMKAAAKAR
jgi:tetrahydromethanopterin S-methyltransferase subunit E